jgi:ribose transport system permease protein
VLAALTIVYAVLDPGLLSVSQADEVFNQSLPLMLVAAGETAVILGGGIDLSVGGIVTLGNVLGAVLMPSHGIAVALLTTLAVGTAAGVANGWFALFWDLPPIIVTLATASLYGGLALAILPQPGGGAPASYAAMATGQLGPVPNALVVVVVLIALWSVFIRLPVGRALKAAGSQRTAAAMIGRPWRTAALASYGISGLLSAASGLAILGQTQTGDPTVGAVYTLLALAAVVLGGVRLSGGLGEVGGPLAGALILSVVNNVLFFMNVSVYYQYVAEGVIVLVPMLGRLSQGRRGAFAQGGE